MSEPRFDARLRRAFAADLRSAGPTGAPSAGPAGIGPVTDGDIAHFDPLVQRYLRFMRIIGRPRVRSFTVDFAGSFRLRPNLPWMPASAHQYNSVHPITRVFTMRLRLLGVVPMLGHDTYLRGTGRMVGKVAGTVQVVDGRGPELDIGELSTWLNDAILLAPSLLLDAPISATTTGSDRFEVKLEDAGHEVSATVTVDESGAPVGYVTTDRWAALPEGMVRAPWRMPAVGWTIVDGRPFPTSGSVVWDLPHGPYEYVRGGFVPSTLRLNVSPAEAARG